MLTVADIRNAGARLGPRPPEGEKPVVEAGDSSGAGNIHIFGDLDRSEIDELVRELPARTAEKGTVLYAAEAGPSELYLLQAGRVELFRRTSSGRKLTLGIVRRGTFFGEMSLLENGQAGTGAVALENSVVYVLSREVVHGVVLRHPRVALRIAEVLARRLNQARESLEEMAFNDVTGRVAGLLLLLADEDGGVIEGYSHQDLAAMVGCLRESMTVTLDRFKRSQAVTIARKRIEITDRSRLHVDSRSEVRPGQKSRPPSRPIEPGFQPCSALTSTASVCYICT